VVSVAVSVVDLSRVDSGSMEEPIEDGAGDAETVNEGVASAVAERIGSRRRRVSTELTCKHGSPSTILIPSWEELKANRWVGESCVKVKECQVSGCRGLVIC
jgi:hypothetical protein